jgi:hypothetical protein
MEKSEMSAADGAIPVHSGGILSGALQSTTVEPPVPVLLAVLPAALVAPPVALESPPVAPVLPPTEVSVVPPTLEAPPAAPVVPAAVVFPPPPFPAGLCFNADELHPNASGASNKTIPFDAKTRRVVMT